MMRIKSIVLSGIMVMSWAGAVQAAPFSIDDFLPPVQTENAEEREGLLAIKDKESIEGVVSSITGGQAIKANSAQDAINAYVDRRSAGFTELQFPNGLGFVASGLATYGKHPSVVATRIDQRNAYIKAYTQAKRELVAGLNGISNQGQTMLTEYMANVDRGDTGTLTNVNENLSERIRQTTEGLLRGYVVYDIYDDFENSTVHVTIVTTPKTQGYFERPDMNTISAASVAEGLNQALMEIQNGLVPPVGGKTIFVPQTGELAFVGFGSSVVRADKDAALQVKHNLNAERLAKMRAVDALCGIILEDQVSASSELDSQTTSMIQDFAEITQDDPLGRQDKDSVTYQALAERKKEFLSVETSSSSISSMRKGVLPPGVKSQSWLDDEKAFAYGVAVYLPSASNRAADARNQMEQGSIVQPVGVQRPAQPGQLPDAGELKQGPSGRVQSDEAL